MEKFLSPFAPRFSNVCHLLRRRLASTPSFYVRYSLVLLGGMAFGFLVTNVCQNFGGIARRRTEKGHHFQKNRAGLPVGRPLSNFPVDFLIEEEDFCHRQKSGLFLLAYVHSSILAEHKRKETRATWAEANRHNASVRLGVVFMVGRATSPEEQRIVDEESTRYRDIVQGNYTDTYEWLSYKALTSLLWVNQHCSGVPWTLHADDDVMVDTFLLSSLLMENLAHEKNRFLCHTWDNARVRRDGRWAVHYDEFPDDVYPRYCMGAAWVLHTPAIIRLLMAVYKVNFLWVDDVYVTGILAEGAGLEHSPWFKKFIATKNSATNDVGKKVIWYHLGEERLAWWKQILDFYGYNNTGHLPDG